MTNVSMFNDVIKAVRNRIKKERKEGTDFSKSMTVLSLPITIPALVAVLAISFVLDSCSCLCSWVLMDDDSFSY